MTDNSYKNWSYRNHLTQLEGIYASDEKSASVIRHQKSEVEQNDYKNFREYAYQYKQESAQNSIQEQNFHLNTRIESIKNRDYELIPKLRKGPFNSSTITKNQESGYSTVKNEQSPQFYSGFSKFEQGRIQKENERLHKRITNVKSNLSARDQQNPLCFKRSRSDDLDNSFERYKKYDCPDESVKNKSQLRYDSSASSIINNSKNNNSSAIFQRKIKKQKNFIRKVKFPPVMRQRLHEYLEEKRQIANETDYHVDFDRQFRFTEADYNDNRIERVASGHNMGSEVMSNQYLKDMINQVKDTLKVTNNNDQLTYQACGQNTFYNPKTNGTSTEMDIGNPNHLFNKSSSKNRLMVTSPGSTYLKFDPTSVSSTKYSKKFNLDKNEMEISLYSTKNKNIATSTINDFHSRAKKSSQLRMSTSGEGMNLTKNKKVQEIFKKKASRSPPNKMPLKINTNDVFIVEECFSIENSADRNLHLSFLKSKQEAISYIKRKQKIQQNI